MMESDIVGQRIRLIMGNIASLPVDAVVTAANSALMGGGGVDGAVHRGAGPELLLALHQLDGCPEGEAVLTPGFNLPATWVIHAVGPIYVNGKFQEAEILASAYRSTLELAVVHNIKTIAFPCIGTGAFRYPHQEACEIAVGVVEEWLRKNELPITVYFCVFEREDAELYEQRLGQTIRPLTSEFPS